MCSLFHIVDDAPMSIWVPVFTWMFISLRYIPNREIAGSYDNSVFNLLRNCHTLFSRVVEPFYIPSSKVYEF